MPSGEPVSRYVSCAPFESLATWSFRVGIIWVVKAGEEKRLLKRLLKKGWRSPAYSGGKEPPVNAKILANGVGVVM